MFSGTLSAEKPAGAEQAKPKTSALGIAEEIRSHGSFAKTAFFFAVFTILAGISVVVQINALESQRLGACVALGIILVVTFGSRLLSDTLEKPLARKSGAVIACACALISALLPFWSASLLSHIISIALLTIAGCINAILWIYYLHVAEHGQVVILVDIFFGLAACLGIALLYAPPLVGIICMVVAELLFAALYASSCHRSICYSRTAADTSKKQRQRNNVVLAGSGALLGFAISHAYWTNEAAIFFPLVAASLLIAGLVFGVLKFYVGYRFEDFLFRYTPALFCVGQFCLPFAKGVWQLLCTAYILSFATVQLFVTIDAVLETIRIEKIPPLEIGSIQFGCIVAGLSVSVFLAVVSNQLVSPDLALIIQIFILTFIILALVTPSPASGYPKPQSEPEPSPTSKHARWSEVFEAIGDEYQLSPRELEVLRLLAKGHSSTHIASELYISTSTARTHIASIYKKTQVHSKEEMLKLLESKRNSKGR